MICPNPHVHSAAKLRPETTQHPNSSCSYQMNSNLPNLTQTCCSALYICASNEQRTTIAPTSPVRTTTNVMLVRNTSPTQPPSHHRQLVEPHLHNVPAPFPYSTSNLPAKPFPVACGMWGLSPGTGQGLKMLTDSLLCRCKVHVP